MKLDPKKIIESFAIGVILFGIIGAIMRVLDIVEWNQ